MKAVLDTNILVSAVIKRVGKPNQILKRARSGFEWLTSEFILSELKSVLARKHIQTKYKKWVTPARQATFLESARKQAKVVEVHSGLNIIADQKDNAILACAVDGQADYLVTGDPHLLKLKSYSGTKILTPAQFLQILRLNTS